MYSHLLSVPVEFSQLGFVQLPEAGWSDMATLQGLNLCLQQLVFRLQCSHLQEGTKQNINLMITS